MARSQMYRSHQSPAMSASVPVGADGSDPGIKAGVVTGQRRAGAHRARLRSLVIRDVAHLVRLVRSRSSSPADQGRFELALSVLHTR